MYDGNRRGESMRGGLEGGRACEAGVMCAMDEWWQRRDVCDGVVAERCSEG